MTTFFSLFSGDLKVINKYFKIYFSGTEDNWNIGLIPKKALIKKTVKFIILYGNSSIKKIKIVEQSDDVSEILFKNITHNPQNLSEEELALFEF